jgi:hypothetical protein
MSNQDNTDRIASATSFAIDGLGPNEQPFMRICVSLDGTCDLAERIINVMFGGQTGMEAAVERFRGYQDAPAPDK